MSQPENLPSESPVILSMTGPDAIRFLNGQITQDVSNLDDKSLPACVTDAKGRLQYYIKVFAGSETGSLWLTCPKDQAAGLRDRLERYLIADDVEVADLTNQWACIHSSHPDPSSDFVRSARGCFGDGFDCWWKTDHLPQLDAIDQAQAKRLRISARIPAWGHELSEGMLPPDAGLDKNAISYHKGCYIGQEVLSRIKSAGKLNRRLAAFEITGEPNEGDLLLLGSKEVGHLTSVVTDEALGFLKKQGFGETDFTIADSAGNSTGAARFSAWA
ncbi:YgfZ/GcvT domain-containing protein [Haloferula sp.]|uniref:CAF17-like 4Fe-4S cluster assembly/insertion protein YgfZ n=1 Tax=Haloferula sp. TaxID=2497595 RepID=UPI003C772658